MSPWSPPKTAPPQATTGPAQRLEKPRCRLLRLGRVDYPEALALQHRIARGLASGQGPETLLLLEHPPTYTLGMAGDLRHLLVSEEALRRQGALLYRVERGGDITYHGPGQLVGYPIFDLRRRAG